MLKNVLEANLHMFRAEEYDIGTTHYVSLYCAKSKRNYEHTNFTPEIFSIEIETHSTEDNIEIACKQYVRDNGFKLEWLDFPRYRVALHHWYRIKEECGEVNMGKVLKELLNRDINNSVFKDVIQLIAWLYSEDIKIVEE